MKQKYTIEDHIAAYRFSEAEAMLKTEISTLKRRRKPTEELSEQLRTVQHMHAQLEATRKVTFIDSLVVPKANFLNHIVLSEESGRLTTYAKTFHTRDTLQCTVYQPEMGLDTYFARPTTQGTPQLCKATLCNGEWSTPEPPLGLNKDDIAQNYPYLLTDGVTIYYGAINPELGMGGYDIYTSRWDDDDKCFLQPENIGFPFCSPSNDMLLAIDEYSNLGWFVTDRNQPTDTVCIYIFIPSTVRQNWIDTGTLTEEQLGSLARISSIADTQTDQDQVEEARLRLQAIRQGNQRQEKEQYEFSFVLAEGRICHSKSELKTAEARKLIDEWRDNDETLRAAEQQIEAMRKQYATAGNARRNQLRTQLLAMEQDYEQRLAAQHTLEKKIRQLEQ